MDRAFMAEFFTQQYEDPIYEAVQGDEEYARLHSKFKESEQALFNFVGGFDAPAWKLYEQLASDFYEAEHAMVKDVYLMGAEDREKMLR